MTRYTPEQQAILDELNAELKSDRQEVGSSRRTLEEVCFTSRSKGRGRPRRESRQVHFLRVDNNHVLPIARGELQRNKLVSSVPEPDVLAEEVLGVGATPDDLLSMVRARTR